MAGIAGLSFLVLLSLWLSAEVWKEIQAGMLMTKSYWMVLLIGTAQAVLLLLAIYLLRAHIGEQAYSFIDKLGITSKNLDDANNELTSKIIPSFYKKGGDNESLPLEVAIIDQMKDYLSLMEKYLTGIAMVQRGIFSFGESGGGMLTNFFEDDRLKESRISTIRFMGTGRGVVGTETSSYQFIRHLQEFFRARGHRFQVFSRFLIIGCKEIHDQFCAKVLALHLLSWLKELHETDHISLPAQVTFEIVYPSEDVFPALVVFEELKALIATPIGFDDREFLARALPIGLQIRSEPIEVPGVGSINLEPTVNRIRKHFDEMFRNAGESEIWGLQKNDGIFVKRFNREIVGRGLAEISRFEKLEKERLEPLLDDIQGRSRTGERAKEILTVDEISELEGAFTKGSYMEEVS